MGQFGHPDRKFLHDNVTAYVRTRDVGAGCALLWVRPKSDWMRVMQIRGNGFTGTIEQEMDLLRKGMTGHRKFRKGAMTREVKFGQVSAFKPVENGWEFTEPIELEGAELTMLRMPAMMTTRSGGNENEMVVHRIIATEAFEMEEGHRYFISQDDLCL